MACVTACPSGVQYDKLIEDARAQVERNWDRPPRERALRRAIFDVFPHPGRLRALVPGHVAAERSCRSTRLERRPRDALPGAARRARAQAQAARRGRAPAEPTRPRADQRRGRSPSSRAACSACCSATSTRRPSTCWPPRASTCTRRARRAAAARSSCTRATTRPRAPARGRRSRRSRSTTSCWSTPRAAGRR